MWILKIYSYFSLAEFDDYKNKMNFFYTQNRRESRPAYNFRSAYVMTIVNTKSNRET
jgi:hypothetical protein